MTGNVCLQFSTEDCNMTLYSNFVFSILILFFALSAAERTEERKLEEQMLEAAREGATTTLLKLVQYQHYSLSPARSCAAASIINTLSNILPSD